MRIDRALFTTVPLFLLVAACSDAGTPTGLAPRAARLEVVGATTVLSSCQTQIDALIALTVGAPIISKNARDRDGLVKILSDENALLGVGKNADAATKLTNYIVKVEQLEGAGRIDAAAGDLLITGANEAIGCINAVGT